MKIGGRLFLNRCFTLAALSAVLMVIVALAGVLLPIIWHGSGAVLFKGTVEFRRMQLEQYGRGDSAAVNDETKQVVAVRQKVYDLLDMFSAGIDSSQLEDRAKTIYRDLGKQLDNREIPKEDKAEIRGIAKDLRDKFCAALAADDKAEALKHIDAVLAHPKKERMKGTAGAALLDMAEKYRQTISSVDLRQRDAYMQSLKDVKVIIKELLGPPPGEPLPALPYEQYGATRWDQAQLCLDRLMWTDTWVGESEGRSLKKMRVSRQTLFAGTELAELFPVVRDNARDMLRPKLTFYWQYILDDNISGHYFGGVGPEIMGTCLLAVLSLLCAMPLGVAAAAYMVECAGDNLATKILRTCVNTLAGVPSVVFGLFGLAFFVLYAQPRIGLHREASIFAGALTLALLVLPVVIRASEEAIRAVPCAYREASLALGASGFRCFMTVTLPAALPGILTGLILSLSRAAGETAPILFTAAVAMGPIPTSIFQPTRTLSYGIYDMAVGDKMAMMAPHNQFGMVLALVALVVVLNLAAIWLRSRMVRKLRGQ